MYLTNRPPDDGPWPKGMTVDALRQLFEQLPGDAIIHPIATGNLMVYAADLRQLGYIDLGAEEYDRFEGGP